MPSSTVTLLTDFGSADGYAGAMKGAVLGVNPEANIVDITHETPSRDVGHAAFVLGSTCPFFSPETIHVAVVDPGVGTWRRALVVVTPHGRFVLPDNGLLTYLAEHHLRAEAASGVGPGVAAAFMEPYVTTLPAAWSAWELTEPAWWRGRVSDTFHGRDVFGPVAAHLSLAVEPERMGRQVEDIVCLRVFEADAEDGVVRGRIVFVDRFGNLVTNVRPSQAPGGALRVTVAGVDVPGPLRSYAEGDGLRVLVGSHGFLEVAEKNGSAAERLSAGVGARVTVTPAWRRRGRRLSPSTR